MSDEPRVRAPATVIRRVEQLSLLEVARCDPQNATVESQVASAGADYYRARAGAIVAGIEAALGDYRRATALPAGGQTQ